MKLKSKVLMFAGLTLGLFLGLESMPVQQSIPIVVVAGLLSVWGMRLVRTG